LPRLLPLAASLKALGLSALCLLPVPAAGQADELPPDQPQIAFAAEYRMERNLGGRFEWGRRRLFVSGPRLRDELLDGDLDPATLLADRQRQILLRFDPADPAHRVQRPQWDDGKALPALARGYGGVARTLGPPRMVGERTIAGHACQRLVWEAVGERQEWCVTAQGVALAAKRNAGSNETRVEAVLLELNTPDASLFDLPPGFAAPD
jgi:hypothetical protein